MTSKVSSENVSPMKIIGDDLNYHLVYNYSSEYAHRLINVGNRYYQYDANGNIVREKDGKFDEETVQYGRVINQETENVYSTDYGWGLYNDETSKTYEVQTYDRTYKWNARNQLISSIDANNQVAYVYGQDGQRTNKYTTSSETVYFNKMWTLHTDSGNSLYGGQYAKNIYLGDTRIVTKLNSGKDPTHQEESQKQYYYHSDHLGSASLISDYNGKEYQRIEYTPYGETWVEKTSNTGNEFLPYKFTGKEIDEETGLYYYGARYLDPKYSLWISTDPALGDYIPGAGKATANDIGNLPGMGGAFNHINFNLYHYAGNNPVKYTDPDGRIQIPVVGNYLMQDMKWRKTVIKGDTYTMGSAGCAVMVTADFLGISPLIVNTKYIDNGDVNWNKVASDNGYETTGRINSSFTKELYDKQNNDTTKEYSTFINVNFDDSNHDHYVGVQGVITLEDKDYMIITPTSINDKLTTYDAATYLDGTKGNIYYPQSRADKGWRVIDGKVCIPTDQIKAYVNFTKDIVNE